MRLPETALVIPPPDPEISLLMVRSFVAVALSVTVKVRTEEPRSIGQEMLVPDVPGVKEASAFRLKVPVPETAGEFTESAVATLALAFKAREALLLIAKVLNGEAEEPEMVCVLPEKVTVLLPGLTVPLLVQLPCTVKLDGRVLVPAPLKTMPL